MKNASLQKPPVARAPRQSFHFPYTVLKALFVSLGVGYRLAPVAALQVRHAIEAHQAHRARAEEDLAESGVAKLQVELYRGLRGCLQQVGDAASDGPAGSRGKHIGI